MKRRAVSACAAVALAASGEAAARCGSGDFLLCEDFDQYCVGAPPYPACRIYGQTIDNAAFWSKWHWNNCGEMLPADSGRGQQLQPPSLSLTARTLILEPTCPG